jgi:hypothetical protein
MAIQVSFPNHRRDARIIHLRIVKVNPPHVSVLPARQALGQPVARIIDASARFSSKLNEN